MTGRIKHLHLECCGGQLMRILLSLAAGVLIMSMGVISWANHSTARPGLESQTPAAKEAARKAWPAFFGKFRAAVSKRDRVALTSMMARDFNGPPNTPEDAFKQWDDPKLGGWVKLDRALAQGAVMSAPPEEGDPAQERPSMTAPPAAERSKRYRGWFAAFTFEEDGKWYCVQFTKF